MLRVFGSVLLWILVVVGVCSGGLWAATAAGMVQPLVVVSGSMEPGIMTGDLVFDTPTPVQDVRVGEVASLPSTYSGKLVTHRITSIAPTDAGFEIRMQGDANEAPDGEPYLVRADASVWQPRLTVAGGGYALEKLAQRGVAVPLLVTLLALMALVVLPGDAEAEGLQAEGSDA